jgi:hypothetical protein
VGKNGVKCESILGILSAKPPGCSPFLKMLSNLSQVVTWKTPARYMPIRLDILAEILSGSRMSIKECPLAALIANGLRAVWSVLPLLRSMRA